MKSQMKQPGIAIAGASFYVAPNGVLVATEDDKRYFTIDGLVALAAPSDIEELDVIKPLQITENGIQHYYKGLCTNALPTNGDAGSADSSNTAHEPNHNYELEEDSEDAEAFIRDLDSFMEGCLPKLAVIAVIVSFILIALFA